MLVRFDCGCVGLHGVQGVAEGHTLLVLACDAEDRAVSLFPRDMSGKTHEPISEDRARGLVREMEALLQDGYKFRTLRALLG